MNLSNVVYDFCSELVDKGGVFEDVMLHADTYEPIKPGKTIRVDEVIESTPRSVRRQGVLIMRETNAHLDVQVVVTPDSEKLDDRKAARNSADELTLALTLEIEKREQGEIGDCVRVSRIRKSNRWYNVANRKTPVAFLRLFINEGI